MVNRDSAIHATPKENPTDIFSIDANHSEIVKFDNKTCQEYLNVRARIINLVQDAHGNSTFEVHQNVWLVDTKNEELTISVEIVLSWTRCEGSAHFLIPTLESNSNSSHSITRTKAGGNTQMAFGN